MSSLPKSSSSRMTSIMIFIRIFMFLMTLLHGVTGKQTFDSCDWKKSGLIHSTASREIEKVQLNCESGSLEWIYPTTALHIQFQYPHSTTDFTACFLPDIDFSGASLIHQGERPPIQENSFGQPTGLHVIYGDPSEKNREKENTERPISEIACVNSTYGKLKMLLMATVPRADISRKVASFKYELYPINLHKHRPEQRKHKKKIVNERKMIFSGNMNDCRPCSTEQLLDLYCSADFVARGHIISVSDDENRQWTNVEFLSNHVMKETPSDWSPFRSPSLIPGFNFSHIPSKDAIQRELYHGIFHVPHQCGFRPPQRDHDHILKDFVIMGNYNFGGGWMECFPKWTELFSVVEQFIEVNGVSRKHSDPDDCNFEELLRSSGA